MPTSGDGSLVVAWDAFPRSFDVLFLVITMKVKYLAALLASSALVVGTVVLPSGLTSVNAAPCAGAPCAAADPCAGNPCAADPCAADPCAADPCAADPCAADPCAADPCAADPCAADPCAADPCAADPCAAADVVQAFEPPHTDVYVETTSNLAIRGADPVAYFEDGQAKVGSAAYEYDWNGATWRFSSAEYMAKFVADPEAYAPQYGGYCAKAMSEGNLASVDPRSWTIEDGKLYLNYSPEVQAQWVEDIPGNIVKADGFWPGVLTSKTFYENALAWAQ
jgi:YHS domain-containing protein